MRPILMLLIAGCLSAAEGLPMPADITAMEQQIEDLKAAIAKRKADYVAQLVNLEPMPEKALGPDPKRSELQEADEIRGINQATEQMRDWLKSQGPRGGDKALAEATRIYSLLVKHGRIRKVEDKTEDAAAPAKPKMKATLPDGRVIEQ